MHNFVCTIRFGLGGNKNDKLLQFHTLQFQHTHDPIYVNKNFQISNDFFDYFKYEFSSHWDHIFNFNPMNSSLFG